MSKRKAGGVSLPAEPPTPKTRSRAADAKQRVEARQTRFEVGFSAPKADTLQIESPHADRLAWQDTLLDAFGTESLAFAISEVTRLTSGLRNNNQLHASRDELNAALAAVDGVRPENEMTAMLASQMALTHSLAMEMLGRTRRAETVEQMQAHGALATKLLRTFTSQTEALAKVRRGGEQTVRVEHVHVYPGGQAIVRAVSNRKVRGGEMMKQKTNPMDRQTGEPLPLRLVLRWLARTRSGTPCQKPAARGKKRCRLHGGARVAGRPLASETAHTIMGSTRETPSPSARRYWRSTAAGQEWPGT